MYLNIYNLEKSKNLPKRLSYTFHGNYKYNDYCLRFITTNKNKNPEYICRYILKKYLGKDFNKAYSEVCKKLPYYQRRYFIKNTLNNTINNRYSKYYVDFNNNIQINENYYMFKKESPVIFYSIDYSEGYYDKSTRIFLSVNEYYNNSFYNNRHCIRVIISGYSKEFSSKKDPEYIKLMKIKNKQIRYYSKINKKKQKHKVYSFLSNEEIKTNKEKELDVIKRDSHGFDENSFKHTTHRKNKIKLKKYED